MRGPTAEVEPAPAGTSPPQTGAPARIGWDRLDAALVLCAAVGTVLLHPVHALLTHPYWLDEAWVAILTKVPVTRLARLTSSTPLGFAFLLRLVPGSGMQRARLVVLAFSALAVVAAYALGRSLPWRTRAVSRWAGAFVASAVLLSPFLLVRNDLKQYTSDAFAALAVLTVAIWVERSAGAARPWWLTVAALVLLPFSTTSAFVTVAAFAGLLAVALSRRRPNVRVADVLVAGGATAAGFGAWFAGIVLPNTNADLRSYWDPFYLHDHAPPAVLREIWHRFDLLHEWIGMPAVVAIGLFVLGIFVLVRVGAPVLAVAVPVLIVEMVFVAMAERYPFLDQRTSTFLLATLIAVVAVGVFGAVEWLWTRRRVAGVVMGAGAASLFALAAAPHVHEIGIPREDVRSETAYVAAHYRPGDVIVVNQLGQYGFSYYWPHSRVTTPRADTDTGFGAEVKNLPAAMYLGGRTEPVIVDALRTAMARRRSGPPGSRLFIVRTHMSPLEPAAWKAAFRTLGLSPRPVRTGGDILLVIGPV